MSSSEWEEGVGKESGEGANGNKADAGTLIWENQPVLIYDVADSTNTTALSSVFSADDMQSEVKIDVTNLLKMYISENPEATMVSFALSENAGNRIHIGSKEGGAVWTPKLQVVESEEEAADQTQLQAFYNKYKDEQKDGYTQESWDTFQIALANAETVLGNAESDQLTINSALTELETAVKGLRVSKATLKYFLDMAKGLVADGSVEGCVESIRNLFDTAIAEGDSLMEKEDATKAEVTGAAAKLMTAIQSLDFKAGNKTDLMMALEMTDLIDLSKYVEAGQAEYLEAKGNAEEVILDEDALQQEVDQAWSDLTDTISQLRLKADKAALEELLKSLEGIDLMNYTEESVSVFNAALEKAKLVLGEESLPAEAQKTVDDAVKELEDAKAALVTKEPAGTDDDEGKPGENGSGNDGGSKPDGNGSGNDGGSKPDGNGSGNDGGSKPDGNGSGNDGGSKPDGNDSGNNKDKGSKDATSYKVKQESKTPKTGDNTEFVMLFITMILACGGVAVIGKRRWCNKNSENTK